MLRANADGTRTYTSQAGCEVNGVWYTECDHSWQGLIPGVFIAILIVWLVMSMLDRKV